MGSLKERHPGTVCVYFACVLLPVMFGINPVTAGLGLAGAMAFLPLAEKNLKRRSLLFYPGVVLASTLVNPLFNHNGRTVLFFLNRNPVTFESVLYGGVMGMIIAAALCWGRCFSRIMDTDRLLTVTGRLSPKAALILSMALRYIPLLRRQAEKTREAQTGLGLIREDNGIDRIRGHMRVFSGMVTWALENGIETADSMTARGYGSGRRTRYRLFVWELGDTAWTALSLLLLAGIGAARLGGAIGYTWYPDLIVPDPGWAGLAAYGGYGLLCFLAAGMEGRERRKWKSLRSGI